MLNNRLDEEPDQVRLRYAEEEKVEENMPESCKMGNPEVSTYTCKEILFQCSKIPCAI